MKKEYYIIKGDKIDIINPVYNDKVAIDFFNRYIKFNHLNIDELSIEDFDWDLTFVRREHRYINFLTYDTYNKFKERYIFVIRTEE